MEAYFAPEPLHSSCNTEIFIRIYAEDGPRQSDLFQTKTLCTA